MSEKLFITFDSAICTEVKTKIDFSGRTYRADRAKAFFDAKICHSLPKGNLNGRGFSAATLANSYKSAEHQLCDFDHRLGFYGTDEDGEDRVCGTIAAADFPDKEEAMALQAEGKSVPFRALLVAFRKAKGVEKMLSDIESEKYNWRTSVEIEYELAKAALYDTVTNKFYPWSDCSQEMKDLVSPASVKDYNGHKMLFVPGGEDGNVIISGCAFTRWPADPNATLEQMAACETPKSIIRLNAGWNNKDDYRQAIAKALGSGNGSTTASKPPLKISEFIAAVATLPSLEKAKQYAKAAQDIALYNQKNPQSPIDASEIFKASNPIIGYTDAAGKGDHKHPITKNLMILPSDGHAHYMGMMSVEKERDGMHICGVTSTRGDFVPNDGSDNSASERYVEHCHTFDLGSASSSEMSGVVVGKEVESMDTKERIKTLRDTAQTLATSNPVESKKMSDLANAIEKEVAQDGIEDVIAARVKNGDLIPKATHEAALATARTEGEAKVRKELEDAKKADELKATTIASRMEAIKKAKINPKFALAANRNVEQTVAAIPVGEEGDKKFAERLEEWQTLQKTTGQMTATEAEAGAGEGTRPPVASTNSSGQEKSSKKSAISFV